jgi:hypothetical protein
MLIQVRHQKPPDHPERPIETTVVTQAETFCVRAAVLDQFKINIARIDIVYAGVKIPMQLRSAVAEESVGRRRLHVSETLKGFLFQCESGRERFRGGGSV